MSTDERMEMLRSFLKDSMRKQFDFSTTDQNRGIQPPPIEKPYAKDAKCLDLIKPGSWRDIVDIDLETAIGLRRSHRNYLDSPLTLEELSFLLWATQGVRGRSAGGSAYRTVPSAGCRHALETYLAVLNVQGLDKGVYRYLPLEHQLALEFLDEGLAPKLTDAALGQPYPGKAAVTFVWTAIPYRMEWRYAEVAHKVIALDAGHVCQNLYLACEAIGAGTCAIAAYDQQGMDRLLRIDGREEFAVYLAPVGKVEE